MCQVHTGAYASLLAPGKTDYTACHPRKTTTYILHVVPITKHTHNRCKSIGKKETKKRKEEEARQKRIKEKHLNTTKHKDTLVATTYDRASKHTAVVRLY